MWWMRSWAAAPLRRPCWWMRSRTSSTKPAARRPRFSRGPFKGPPGGRGRAAPSGCEFPWIGNHLRTLNQKWWKDEERWRLFETRFCFRVVSLGKDGMCLQPMDTIPTCRSTLPWVGEANYFSAQTFRVDFGFGDICMFVYVCVLLTVILFGEHEEINRGTLTKIAVWPMKLASWQTDMMVDQTTGGCLLPVRMIVPIGKAVGNGWKQFEAHKVP